MDKQLFAVAFGAVWGYVLSEIRDFLRRKRQKDTLLRALKAEVIRNTELIQNMQCNEHPRRVPVKSFYSDYLLLDDEAWNQFKMTGAVSILTTDVLYHLSPAYASIKSFNSLVRKTDWHDADIKLHDALQSLIDSIDYFLGEVSFDIEYPSLLRKIKTCIPPLFRAFKCPKDKAAKGSVP